jgi:hypothetical protein
MVCVTLPGVCCASWWDVYKAANGNWGFWQHVCVWLCWFPRRWCQDKERMPRVCYQQYVQSSQNKEAILQMLHYFYSVYFITDCLYQCLLPFMQRYLNNNFTLLKFWSFNTLNILGHKVHRNLDMFFISTKEIGTSRKPEKSGLPVQRQYWAVLSKPTYKDFSFIEVDGVFGNIHT